MTDRREEAWAAVHEALLARWRLGPTTFDPGRHLWFVTARDGTRGRGRLPVTASGSGVDETAALRDLNDRLRGVPQPDGSRFDEFRRRARLRYLAGAEEWTRRELGRGLRVDELARVVARVGPI